MTRKTAFQIDNYELREIALQRFIISRPAGAAAAMAWASPFPASPADLEARLDASQWAPSLWARYSSKGTAKWASGMGLGRDLDVIRKR